MSSHSLSPGVTCRAFRNTLGAWTRNQGVPHNAATPIRAAQPTCPPAFRIAGRGPWLDAGLPSPRRCRQAPQKRWGHAVAVLPWRVVADAGRAAPVPGGTIAAIRWVPAATRGLPAAIRWVPAATRGIPAAIRWVPAATCRVPGAAGVPAASRIRRPDRGEPPGSRRLRARWRDRAGQDQGGAVRGGAGGHGGDSGRAGGRREDAGQRGAQAALVSGSG